MSVVLLSRSAYPPTSDVLNEALVIKGPYRFGPSPGAWDNRLFMDELDHFTDDEQRRILDQYQKDGYTSITLGPAVAIGYHHDYPDTNWLRDPSRIIATMHECRRRGLRITLAVLPDCAPYFDGRTWDWARVESDLTPLYARPEFQELVENIQCEWEVNCANDVACQAGAYCARVFPRVTGIWWHTEPGHSAPGLSSESISEADMWRNLKNAVLTANPKAELGWAMQDDSIYLPLPEDQQWQNFCANVRDMVRHCEGYNHWPLLRWWAREYRAYAIYNWNAPVTGGPEDWGTSARENGSPNIGDGGPRT